MFNENFEYKALLDTKLMSRPQGLISVTVTMQCLCLFKCGNGYWITSIFGIFPRFLIVLKDSNEMLKAIFAYDRNRDDSVKSFICDAPIFFFFVLALFSFYVKCQKWGE
jgi:hypothetical protein